MKRKILVIAVMSLMLGACSSNAQTTDNITQDNDENISIETDKNLQENVELSIETLSNTEETSSDEFRYVEFEGEVIISEFIGESEIVVIPDEIEGSPVIEISRTAFANNESVKAVKIGNNVKIIRDRVFGNCTSLEYVILGESVEVIEDDCFLNCYSMKEIQLNEGLLTIGELVFPDTDEPLIVPRSVTSIGDGAFGMPVQVHAGTYAEEFMKTYATYYNGYTYEVIE